MGTPLVITALRIEHDALRRGLAGRNATLRCLGPGRSIATRLDFTERPSFVLLAGVAGGLATDPPERTARVIDTSSGEAFTPTIAHDPRGAVIACTDEPVTTPDEKRRLAHAHGAHLVDTESSAVARVCENAGVPWGVLRTVSDAPDEALPGRAPSWIDAKGGTRIGRVVLDAVRSPRLIADLRRLARDTNGALRELVPLVEQCLDEHA